MNIPNRWIEIIENTHEDLPYEMWISYRNKDCNCKIAQFLHYDTAIKFAENRVRDIAMEFAPEIKVNVRKKFIIKVSMED